MEDSGSNDDAFDVEDEGLSRRGVWIWFFFLHEHVKHVKGCWLKSQDYVGSSGTF